MAILSLCLFRVAADTGANTLGQIALNQAADREISCVINKHLETRVSPSSRVYTVTELLVGRL